MLNWFHFALVATVDTHMSFEPPTPQTKVQNTAKQKKHMPGDCRKISLSRDNQWTRFGFQHRRFSVASSHCAATVAFCLHVADSVPVALKQAVANQHLKRQKGYEDDDDSHDDSDDNHNEWRSVTNLILATVTNNDKHGAMLLGDPIFNQNADSVVNLHQIARPFTLLAVVFHDQLLCLSQSFCCSHCDLLCSPRSSYIPQNEKKKMCFWKLSGPLAHSHGVFVSIYHGKKVEAEEDQKTKAMAVKIIEHVKILSSAFQMRRPMADGMQTG